MTNKGLLLIISGPSGCGKGTVCDALKKRNEDIKVSVSATTRDMRKGEVDGVTYFFKTEEEFRNMIINDEFFEYNCGYNNNYYGTPKKYVFDQMEAGYDVILEIEMNGAQNVKKQYPEGVLIFLSPPSLDELHSRLVGRGRESQELIEERFNEAKNEMQRAFDYDYFVINDTVDEAVKRIETIIAAEKYQVRRNKNIIKDIID